MKRPRIGLVFPALILVGSVSLPAWATERHVPGQYPTIQAAIDAAVPGDEILVADGIYTGLGNKDLDFGGKAITVRSASGNPALCIIDCENSGRGFYFHSGESAAAIVQGLTISNGNMDAGGGVYCDSSSPTLTNCTITGNTGGGVYCYGSSPALTNCTITGNYWSGVCCYNSSPTLTNCTITGNGNGVSGEFSSPTLTNCTIMGNGNGADISFSSPMLTCCTIVGNDGSGVYFEASNATLTQCTITQNAWGVGCESCDLVLTHCTITDNGGGGGVRCWEYSRATLINCTISENTSLGAGGGVASEEGSSMTLANCTISGNTSLGAGGGVYCSYSSPALTNCTIAENTASLYGGGVYCTSTSSPTLTNCILWANTPQEIYVSSGSPVVTYCDVQGGYAGTGNINSNPLFVEPDNDDFRVQSSSPCIDAGDPNFVPTPGETDLDGNQRVWDGNGDGTAIVDMGAYEFGSHAYGDLNCDGEIDFGDINPFVLALTSWGGYQEQYPNCDIMLADINGDGYVSFADINPFVTLLAGG